MNADIIHKSIADSQYEPRQSTYIMDKCYSPGPNLGQAFNQEILTEGEGSVQLTSLH
jgi:hypothetical protein